MCPVPMIGWPWANMPVVLLACCRKRRLLPILASTSGTYLRHAVKRSAASVPSEPHGLGHDFARAVNHVSVCSYPGEDNFPRITLGSMAYPGASRHLALLGNSKGMYFIFVIRDINKQPFEDERCELTIDVAWMKCDFFEAGELQNANPGF